MDQNGPTNFPNGRVPSRQKLFGCAHLRAFQKKAPGSITVMTMFFLNVKKSWGFLHLKGVKIVCAFFGWFFSLLLFLQPFVENSVNYMVKHHVLQHHLCCFVGQVSDLQASTSTDFPTLVYLRFTSGLSICLHSHLLSKRYWRNKWNVYSEAHLLPRLLIAVQPSNCLVEQSKCPGTGCTGSGRKPRLTLFFTVKYGEIRNANHRHVACLDCVWLSCFKFLLICHQVQKCFFLAKTGKNRRSPDKLRRKKKTPVTPLYLLLQASSLKPTPFDNTKTSSNFIRPK